MAWKTATIVQQREALVRDWLAGSDISNLSRIYGVSRVTVYKWIGRYEAGGREALVDRSPVAKSHPHETDSAICSRIIALRQRYPHWGPKKLVTLLHQRWPRIDWPAVSTIGDILDRAGLIRKRPRRPRPPLPTRPPGGRGMRPNEVWCIDYKGEFRLGNSEWCYPLTVTDESSRYILACRAFARICGEDVRRTTLRLFGEHGLPDRIRSDNGSPFASIGLGRLSQVSVEWMRLGIGLDRNHPGHPQHNGRHERMHRGLKAETTRPPEANLRRQQHRFDDFCCDFNEVRPHEALNQRTPASVYRPSRRQLPSRIEPIEYPGHYEVRLVGSNGCIRFRSDEIFLTTALEGEYVGLTEIDDGCWAVYFASTCLAHYRARERDLIGFGRQ